VRLLAEELGGDAGGAEGDGARERDGFLCCLAEGRWSYFLGCLGVVLRVVTTVWGL
jgi:hypothetical protein